jgi:transposase
MGALSRDLRIRIINAWRKKKLTTKQLAELFDVGEATVTRLKKTFRETKLVDPKPHGGGHPPRISKENESIVEALVQSHPDWSEAQYAKELSEKYGIAASSVTVGRVIRRLGYSVKKRVSSRASATDQTSLNADGSTANKSKTSPLRVWFLWTKRVRTSR